MGLEGGASAREPTRSPVKGGAGGAREAWNGWEGHGYLRGRPRGPAPGARGRQGRGYGGAAEGGRGPARGVVRRTREGRGGRALPGSQGLGGLGCVLSGGRGRS